MEQILSFIASNFKETLIMFLLVSLFFKESLVSYINGIIGRDSKKTPQEKSNDVYQTQIDSITKDINDIKTNHLFHIEADMVIVKEGLAFIKGKLSK